MGAPTYTPDDNGFARVSARLVDDQGRPVADVPLHFSLTVSGNYSLSAYVAGAQSLDPQDAGGTVWQVDSTTDHNGVGEALLPVVLGGPLEGSQPAAGSKLQVQATFDGRGGPPALRPQFATAAVG